MAAEMDGKSELNDLPDLEASIDEANALPTNEAFEKELGIELQDDVDLMDSLHGASESLGANDEDAYIAGDVEDKTIDEMFLKKITEPYTGAETEENDDDTLIYHEDPDDYEAQLLHDSSDVVLQGDDESNETPSVLNQNTSMAQLIDGRLIQLGQPSEGPVVKSGVTFINKSDLLQLPNEVRVVKRPIQATPAKNFTSKIFIQHTAKGPMLHRNFMTTAGAAHQELPLSQAKRLGLVTPKMTQLLRANTPRLAIKSFPSGSLIKGPAKILPAPAQKSTNVRDTLPISVIRTNIPQSKVRTILTNTSTTVRPISITKTVGGLTTAKLDTRTPHKLIVRPGNLTSGGVKIPFQLAGKTPIQVVKLVGSSSGVSFTAVRPKMSTPGRIFLNMNADGKKPPIQVTTSTPLSFKGKTYTTIKVAPPKDIKPPELVTIEDNEEDGGPRPKIEPRDLIRDGELSGLRDIDPLSPNQILEANGIRPKKPCNCTRSQCLKLYCECFANGEFCFQCNCNNCFNNIEHEEERQHSIRSCLDRNPSAFQPKIQLADSDEEERRHNKGCNCKRSHCLKNYCECFEAKLTCGKYCKCLTCRNTEEDLAAWEQGERVESGEDEPATKASPYLPQNVAQALCDCILVQAEESERRGENIIQTELRIIEELGQRLVQLIGNRTKKDSR